MATNVGPGDVVVVHAAAGGTGGAIVQLAATAEAEVIAFTSTADKAKAAIALGADHAFALTGTPIRSLPSCPSPPARAHRWCTTEMAGTPLTPASNMLDRFGTLVLYGQSGGAYVPFDPADSPASPASAAERAH